MPRRIKDKNKSIFVRFLDDANTKEIYSLLDSLSIKGIKVSTLINRWAIEVPFWKEEFYTDKLLESEIVETVHENPNKRRGSAFQSEDEINEAE